MNSQQIVRILGEKDPAVRRVFGGVLPRDYLFLALLQPGPKAWVINTDPSHRRGQHWFALFTTGKGQVDYFDSYFQSPAFYGLSNRMFRPAYPRHPPLQDFTQHTCGHFVITYLALRARGHTPRDIIDYLASQGSPDATVVRFVRSMYSQE